MGDSIIEVRPTATSTRETSGIPIPVTRGVRAIPEIGRRGSPYRDVFDEVLQTQSAGFVTGADS
jgi:hypothetical protein